MKPYRVPVSWTMTGTVIVQAGSLAEACDRAEADPNICLPEGEYLEDSWRVDREWAEEENWKVQT